MQTIDIPAGQNCRLQAASWPMQNSTQPAFTYDMTFGGSGTLTAEVVQTEHYTGKEQVSTCHPFTDPRRSDAFLGSSPQVPMPVQIHDPGVAQFILLGNTKPLSSLHYVVTNERNPDNGSMRVTAESDEFNLSDRWTGPSQRIVVDYGTNTVSVVNLPASGVPFESVAVEAPFNPKTGQVGDITHTTVQFHDTYTLGKPLFEPSPERQVAP